jgi:hypothetical protein
MSVQNLNLCLLYVGRELGLILLGRGKDMDSEHLWTKYWEKCLDFGTENNKGLEKLRNSMLYNLSRNNVGAIKSVGMRSWWTYSTKEER